MNKNHLLFGLCIGFIFLSIDTLGQFNLKNAPIKLSYYSNMLINPGLSVGTEFVLKEKTTKASNKMLLKGKDNLKRKAWLLHGQIGAYTHPYNHSVVFSNYEIRYRKTNKRGRKYFVGLGLGLERSFLPETYEVKANGDINKIPFPGHFYVGPVWSTGMHMKRKFFASQNELFFEIQIPFLIDYNNTVVPKINFSIGMSIHQKKSHEKTN